MRSTRACIRERSPPTRLSLAMCCAGQARRYWRSHSTKIITNLAIQALSPCSGLPRRTALCITRNCLDPQVSVALLDAQGTTLAHKTVSLTSAGRPYSTITLLILIGLGLLLCVLLVIYMLKRSRGDALPLPPPQTLVFLLLVGAALVVPTNSAKADTFSNDVTYTIVGNPIDVWDFSLTYTVNLDKSVYLPGETISVTQYDQPYVPSYYSHPGDVLVGVVSLRADAGASGGWFYHTYVDFGIYPNPPYDSFYYYFYDKNGLLQLTAPSSPGTYEVNFLSTIDYYIDTSPGYAITYPDNVTIIEDDPFGIGSSVRYTVSYSIPFTVAAVPIPTSPTISGSCDNVNHIATFSWKNSGGATTYHLRVT